MSPKVKKPYKSLSLVIGKTTALLFLPALVISLQSSVYAQGAYSSGSTGADGAFNPTTSQTIQLPESGIFNYTTVTIPTNVTVRYKRNSRNTPVIILATGNVAINGAIVIDGGTPTSFFWGGFGGPGGFDGGQGGTSQASNPDGFNGSGPGAGLGGDAIGGTYFGGGGGSYATAGSAGVGTGGGAAGPIYGSPSIIPLIGGSGGGGGASSTSLRGASGGGGGGAIFIASSGSISGLGNIYTRGGAGMDCGGSNGCGGGGSGGAVRLAANTISGGLGFYVHGGGGGTGNANPGGGGGAGYVNIESYDLSNFSPIVYPSFAIVTNSVPRPPTVSNAPQIRIVSVAGVNAPTYLWGSFGGADIILPSTQTGPVTVALSAENIPTGTVLDVSVSPRNGSPATVQSTPLSGTPASSTATASVTLPAGMSLIHASATVDLTLISNLAPIFIEGERVRKIEVAATFGGKSEVTYITASGKRVR